MARAGACWRWCWDMSVCVDGVGGVVVVSTVLTRSYFIDSSTIHVPVSDPIGERDYSRGFRSCSRENRWSAVWKSLSTVSISVAPAQSPNSSGLRC